MRRQKPPRGGFGVRHNKGGGPVLRSTGPFHFMSHLRPKLKIGDKVHRIDDPRHTGVVIGMFKWKKHGWHANVIWDETGWFEYVPMNVLVQAYNVR
jgi:hypothetical protein